MHKNVYKTCLIFVKFLSKNKGKQYNFGDKCRWENNIKIHLEK